MKYVIIGGNATGMSAAVRLRKNCPEAQIIVLEKSGIVSFGECGLPYYVAGEFSDEKEFFSRSVEDFIKSGIDVRLFHEAIELDSKNKLLKGKAKIKGDFDSFSVEFDKLLIATGASPIYPGSSKPSNVFTMSKLSDANGVKEMLSKVNNITIIGGGFIGIEMAEAFLHLGKKVNVILQDDFLCRGPFDSEIPTLLAETMQADGVEISFNEKFVDFEIDTHNVATAVKTDKNSYKTDLVIMAIGFRPNTSFINDLDKLGNSAIKVNEFCECSEKDIYSAGDCASVLHLISGEQHYIPLATTANKLGRLLGDIMADKKMPFAGTLGSACLRFNKFEMARTGLGEFDLQKLNIPYKTNVISDFNHTSYVPSTRGKITVKLLYHAESKVLLGAQIGGASGAVLRIDALAVAIAKKMTVSELGMFDFAYSPPFARTWDVLNIAGNTSK